MSISNEYNVLSIEEKKIELNRYFKTKIAIDKHCHKCWADLPKGFKTFIHQETKWRLK